VIASYRFPANAHLFGMINVTIKLYTGSNSKAARTLLYTVANTFDR